MRRSLFILFLLALQLIVKAQDIHTVTFMLDGVKKELSISSVDSVTFINEDGHDKQIVWKDGEKNIDEIHDKDKIEFSSEVLAEPVDLSGTWICKEIHYSLGGTSYEVGYVVNLKKDGTVSYSESETICSSSWNFNRDTGEVLVDIMDVATQFANSGKKWVGKVDDINDPHMKTKETYRWNFNAIGSFNGDSYEFKMVKGL